MTWQKNALKTNDVIEQVHTDNWDNGIAAALTQDGVAAEFIRDTIGTALVAGSGVTIAVNDPADTITITATGTGGAGTSGDASTTTKGVIQLTGDLAGLAASPRLAASGIPSGLYNLADLTSLTVDAKGRVTTVARTVPGQDIAWVTGAAALSVAATIPQATHVFVTQAGIAAYTRLTGSSSDGGLVAYPTGDNRLQAYVQGGAYLTQSNAVIDWTKPHIVAFVHDASTGFLTTYCDGIPIGTDRRSGGFAFTGTGTVTTAGATEYRRWNRALYGPELRQTFTELSLKYAITLTPRISATTPMPLLVANVRGSNQHPKTAQFSGGLNVFEQFWGAQWDWAWVQDSIDKLALQGGHVYRVIGDVAGIQAGTINQSTYTARLTQIADYITSKGMRLYYCGGDMTHRGNAVQADIVAQYVAAAQVLQSHAANVFGFDIANEIRSAYGTGTGKTPKTTLVPYLQAAAAAIRTIAPDVPLSISDVGGGGSDDGGSAGGVVSRSACFGEYQLWAPSVDFFDLHAYEDVAGEFRPWQLAPYTTAIDRPLVLGEYGTDLSGTNGDATGAALYSRVNTLRAATPGVHAALSWAIRNDLYGLYTETSSTLRTATAATFNTRPAVNPLSAAATAYTDEQAQDAAAALFTSGGHTGITFTYDDTGNRILAAVTSTGGGGAPLNIVNVRDYGAKGDNSTDDSVAVKNAIAAVAGRGNNNSGIVYFPPGTYLSSSKLTVPANIKLVGEGAGTSLLLYSGATDAAGVFVTFGVTGTINTNGGVERMQIDANLKLGWCLLLYGPQEGSDVWMSLIRGGTTGGIDCRSSGINGGNNKFLIASSWVWADGPNATYGAKFDDANGPFAIRDTTFVRTGSGSAPVGSAGIYFNGGYQHVANVNCEQWESHTSIDAWSNYRADTLSSYGCTYGITRRAYSGADPAVRVAVENLTFDSATAYIRDLQQGITVTSCKRWSNREVDSSAWNGAHLTLGTYHLWVDTNGELRMKASAPTSATDGALVGTQS